MADSERFVEVECTVLRFEPNPKGGQNIFVQCRLGGRVWVKNLWVNYEKPITFEQFKGELAATDLIPKVPEDPLAYVKEQTDKPFTLLIERPVTDTAAPPEA